MTAYFQEVRYTINGDIDRTAHVCECGMLEKGVKACISKENKRSYLTFYFIDLQLLSESSDLLDL